MAHGRARIVTGARSALFLPYANLGLIVVDEEHDGSYKQQDGIRYHARDFALVRGKALDVPVLLGSATPSLETLWNAQGGRYDWLKLGARHGTAVLPDIALLDLRQNTPDPQTWLSQPLREAIGETLAKGEQTLLFLNRRGYAPVVLCRACGHRLTAPDTDSWLVEHRYTGRLVCHLTGFSMARPKHCPSCGAEDTLVPVGPGVERVEEEVRQLFPQARTAVFSSDTAPDARSARALIQRMTDGEIDILVATQAAAKGHNFPRLTLVGVVDADLGLRGGDLRAALSTKTTLPEEQREAGQRLAQRRDHQHGHGDHIAAHMLGTGDGTGASGPLATLDEVRAAVNDGEIADAVDVAGLVDLAPVEVDESVTAPGGGQRRVDAVVEPLGRVERRAAQGGVRQARAVEVAGSDHGGTQPGGVGAFEHRRVRLPRLRIRPVLPRQLVEHAPRRGVDDEVAGQAVRAGGQTGAERAHRRRRRRREARGEGLHPLEVLAQERCVRALTAQQPRAQPVGEDDDRRARLRQLAPGPRERDGVEAACHGRQHTGEPVGVVAGSLHRGRQRAAEPTTADRA